MGEPLSGPAQNTNRELWREREDDYYADSIHVTAGGGIGINCGGTVIVKPVREWHRLAMKEVEVEVKKKESSFSRAYGAHLRDGGKA